VPRSRLDIRSGGKSREPALLIAAPATFFEAASPSSSACVRDRIDCTGASLLHWRTWKAALTVFKGGAIMPSRARLIFQYLKLVTFLAVWIALLWSVWRLLS
jgi:hypothetical protein